jgi:isoquinoline 1-oxidoreductase subunit alpha
MPTTFQLNGKPVTLTLDAETPLLWAIRDEVGLTGSKFGCGIAQCGACTMLIDGAPERSCSIRIGDCAGKQVTTIEGLSGRVAAAVTAAWQKLDVAQCGYCQSGQIVAATALLTSTAKPTDKQIDDAMSGNICRCATYVRVKAAIKQASAGI